MTLVVRSQYVRDVLPVRSRRIFNLSLTFPLGVPYVSVQLLRETKENLR